MIDNLLLPRQDFEATLEKIDFLIKSESKHIVKYIGHFKCKERPCVATLFYKVGFLYLLYLNYLNVLRKDVAFNSNVLFLILFLFFISH